MLATTTSSNYCLLLGESRWRFTFGVYHNSRDNTFVGLNPL